jgi:hypothetical protein
MRSAKSPCVLAKVQHEQEVFAVVNFPQKPFEEIHAGVLFTELVKAA